MISSAEILEFITKKIKSKFEKKCYFDETRDSYELPAFFARIEQTNFKRDNHDFNNITNICYIAYRQKKIDIADQLDTYEIIKEMFYKGLEMESGYVPVESINYGFTGEYNDIIQIEIRMEYTEENAGVDTEEKIESFEINKKYTLEEEM